ncbi:hypothetical protein F5B22DRAFT_346135 [Xylaria bambusicola]|uniref:uncharacterized protein n=1 Tax=Xylaria bambusicola TaxID=326684 RepID=UPI0020089DF7|nr:uncharacterized protein F5B22DRAFT_346135 [Xylaria bambusicola]KAI0525532.1 hypothetical protein F5B22DRAFT_346135 [Xylaria bambusicola]
MWSKPVSGFFGVVAVLTFLATIVRADVLAPNTLVAILHSFTSKTRCHCAVRAMSLAVDTSATNWCNKLPFGFQPQAVDIDGDWEVFLFDKPDCTDTGGWLVPRTAEYPHVCNYDLGITKAYAVLRPDHDNKTNLKTGDRRGKVDQHCGS